MNYLIVLKKPKGRFGHFIKKARATRKSSGQSLRRTIAQPDNRLKKQLFILSDCLETGFYFEINFRNQLSNFCKSDKSVRLNLMQQ